MTVWQASIAVSLLIHLAIGLGGWWFVHRRLRPMLPALPPRIRLFANMGWLLGLWPVAEAGVLWAGGWWA